MVAEEEIINFVSDWNSFILTFFILGIGYIGLTFLEHLRESDISKMILYDKIMRSALIGFISFSIIITSQGISLTDKLNIYSLIGNYGLVLFFSNLIICLIITYAIYFVLYVLLNPKIEHIKN